MKTTMPIAILALVAGFSFAADTAKKNAPDPKNAKEEAKAPETEEDAAILAALAEKVVYTGPVDAYFGFSLGTLEYRSAPAEGTTAIIRVPKQQEDGPHAHICD